MMSAVLALWAKVCGSGKYLRIGWDCSQKDSKDTIAPAHHQGPPEPILHLMDYWQSVQFAAGVRNYPLVLAGLVACALLLGAILPSARRRLRAAVLLILLW